MGPLEKMCKALGVSKSGFYKWRNRKPSNTAIQNHFILQQVKTIYQNSHATYGSPRITTVLRKNGCLTSRPRVARIMKKAGIKATKTKKFIPTTDTNHPYPVAPNLLNRNFKVDRLAQAWVSDITYVRTIQGWVYLTTIMDLADRKIIGWAISEGLSAQQTVVPAFKMAVNNRPLNLPLIFHSDRGVQYACKQFTSLLKAYPMISQSMSRRANCWDNAVAESFFKTLKVEWVYNKPRMDNKQTANSLFDFIEVFYNRQRIHSAIGYKTPCQREQELNNINLAA